MPFRTICSKANANGVDSASNLRQRATFLGRACCSETPKKLTHIEVEKAVETGSKK
jgi:hypothetical protein